MPDSDPGAPLPVRAGLFVADDDGVSLLASECAACATLAFPVAPVCPECQDAPSGTRRLSRRGTVYSFTVVRSRPPDYAGPVPYGLGLVELPEGIRVFGMLVVNPDAPLAVGAEVESVLVDVGGEEPRSSYAFRMVGADA